MARRKIIKVVVCALVLAACLFMALVIGDDEHRATALGWMPLFSVIVLIALAFAYVSVAQRSLRFYETADTTYCTRGDSVPFSVEFENRSLLVLLNVSIELFVSDVNGDVAQTSTTSLTLGPHAKCEVPFNVPLEHVGMFQAGLRCIVITDFLGLFERKTVVEKTSHICVMPRVPKLASLEFSDDSEAENFKMLKTALADSLDYAYVRDYEPGDPLKTIHWKLSARSGQYLTRLFEKTISPGVIVVMDFHVSGQDVDESMKLRDAVIESALCVADYARSKGLDTEICYTNRFGERRNLGAWDEAALLNLVAEMPQATGDELVKQQTIEHVQQIALNRQAQNNVVVCTANVGADMVGTVIMARQSRKNPFMVCAVPHRLVDRDLERYVVQLGALDDYRIGYQVISASDDLQGRDLS